MISGVAEILVVESDPAFAQAAAEILGGARPLVRVRSVPGHERAHELLRMGNFVPDLVIASASAGAVELVHSVKANPATQAIPLIAIFEPDELDAVQEAYDALANCCVEASRDLASYCRAVEAIARFWFGFVVLPRAVRPAAGVARAARS